jgi:hypothetical protein
MTTLASTGTRRSLLLLGVRMRSVIFLHHRALAKEVGFFEIGAGQDVGRKCALQSLHTPGDHAAATDFASFLIRR